MLPPRPGGGAHLEPRTKEVLNHVGEPAFQRRHGASEATGAELLGSAQSGVEQREPQMFRNPLGQSARRECRRPHLLCSHSYTQPAPTPKLTPADTSSYPDADANSNTDARSHSHSNANSSSNPYSNADAHTQRRRPHLSMVLSATTVIA